MTKVYFVRHAEPNYNNHNDFLRELTSKGMEDRKLVTKFLEDKHIDIVLSSPYKRAVDTVKDFADGYGIKIDIVNDFRERKVDSGWIEILYHLQKNSGVILHINCRMENAFKKFRREILRHYSRY